jgi:Skp family chaperone for outer membrane proteins
MYLPAPISQLAGGGRKITSFFPSSIITTFKKLMSNRNVLEIIEYISIGASVTGTIAALITKQFVFAASPLVITLALNGLNRHQQNQELRRLQGYIDYNKLVKISQDIITLNDDYRFYKLEVSKEINKLKTDCNKLTSEIKDLQIEIDNLSASYNLISPRLSNIESSFTRITKTTGQSKDLEEKSQPLEVETNRKSNRKEHQDHHNNQKSNKKLDDEIKSAIHEIGKGIQEIGESFIPKQK